MLLEFNQMIVTFPFIPVLAFCSSRRKLGGHGFTGGSGMQTDPGGHQANEIFRFDQIPRVSLGLAATA